MVRDRKPLRVKSTGMFTPAITVGTTSYRLPDVHGEQTAIDQQQAMLQLKGIQGALQSYVDTMKRAHDDALVDAHDATSKQYTDVCEQGGYYLARLVAGDTNVVYCGPKRRKQVHAAIDAIFLRNEPDKVAAVQLMSTHAPPFEERLPPGVSVNAHGLYGAFATGPGKTLFNGPFVHSMEEAIEHKQRLEAIKAAGGSLAEAIKALHREVGIRKGKFTEAKGLGWQPKDFKGMPYYRTREQASEMAHDLRDADVFHQKELILREQRKVKDQNDVDMAVNYIGDLEPVEQVAIAPIKRMIICADVCVPSPEVNAERCTGRIWAKFWKHLEPAFEHTSHALRTCTCACINGLCDSFTAEDRSSAKLAFAPWYKEKAALFLIPGRAWGVLAYEIAKAGVTYETMPHPSRWVCHLYAARAARAVNALLGDGTVTQRQLWDMAIESRSEKQLENCRVGRFGYRDDLNDNEQESDQEFDAVAENDEQGVDCWNF